MPHILIVEDEAAIADTLIYALQSDGFTTSWLGLGQAAVEHQRRTPADLIILDIGLPRLSERFYSLPRPDSGRKSTGLGLNFVEEVVSLHGGEMRIGNVEGGVLVTVLLQ
ncbi:response regulator [Pseudomonas sp. DSP3-2-2]|uniref:response regulator n=1 Tax=unclassified Pseudomonas TaxID=196821 RepID=UPI003CEE1C3A